MARDDFAHPNDLDAEQRLIAVLVLTTDDRRPVMLERAYAGLFVHPFFRWLFEQVAEIHASGKTTWLAMMAELRRREWNGRHIAPCIARLWWNIDGTTTDCEIVDWTADYHTLHKLANERYMEATA